LREGKDFATHTEGTFACPPAAPARG
jgi:hypothetical protein